MCKSLDEIRESIERLPEIPCLNETMLINNFHGVVKWKVLKGNMLSFRVFDHPICEIYHTIFESETEISWHTHGKSYERIICLKGKLRVYFENGIHTTLGPKEELKIESNVVHMATAHDECEILAMTIPKEQ